MRLLGWIILILLIIGGVWYFAFYNDAYESTDNGNNPAGIVEENDDRFAITIDQELGADDNGGTFYYLPETRFSIVVAETSDTPEVSCTPEGSIGAVSNEPEAPEGQEAFAFETVSEGSCQISIGDFSATINVIDPSKG